MGFNKQKPRKFSIHDEVVVSDKTPFPRFWGMKGKVSQVAFINAKERVTVRFEAYEFDPPSRWGPEYRQFWADELDKV